MTVHQTQTGDDNQTEGHNDHGSAMHLPTHATLPGPDHPQAHFTLGMNEGKEHHEWRVKLDPGTDRNHLGFTGSILSKNRDKPPLWWGTSGADTEGSKLGTGLHCAVGEWHPGLPGPSFNHHPSEACSLAFTVFLLMYFYYCLCNHSANTLPERWVKRCY